MVKRETLRVCRVTISVTGSVMTEMVDENSPCTDKERRRDPK